MLNFIIKYLINLIVEVGELILYLKFFFVNSKYKNLRNYSEKQNIYTIRFTL